MKECCSEFKAILDDIAAVKAEAPKSSHERLDRIAAFVKAEWDRHTDEAGESSWDD